MVDPSPSAHSALGVCHLVSATRLRPLPWQLWRGCFGLTRCRLSLPGAFSGLWRSAQCASSQSCLWLRTQGCAFAVAEWSSAYLAWSQGVGVPFARPGFPHTDTAVSHWPVHDLSLFAFLGLGFVLHCGAVLCARPLAIISAILSPRL